MSLFQPLPTYRIRSRNKVLDLSQPQVMGILNVTPDSFSDGGQFTAVDKALQHCKQLINEGATIIDIGGESTRPNATPVATDEEVQRVVPVVTAIRQQLGEMGQDIWLSIDTSSPTVMQAAFDAGADIWNDVRALRREGAAQLAAALDIPVMLMHMRGEPTTMNELAQYDEVIGDVSRELLARIEEVTCAGVKRENLIIDPGFGFAKDYEHHRALLTQLDKLQTLGLPLMFGISRKRFLAQVLTKSGVPAVATTQASERDAIGTAAGLLALQQGASIIRTHNVAMMQQAAALWQQLTEYHQTSVITTNNHHYQSTK
ncbi:dihydropteroate synthase [Psychrobacter halodurans]|uniref:Dihydropteroate synthase n=1 Tax=Psychrobacter halodurans TaxID=2818439 RepID=A0AAW4ING7_9GAMM|nr:dihydropteroate synthase [Psychrobacter halodurans]MBO1517012.1 dihydropteroate synthase [Psychrobacter halodurans]